MLQSVKDAYLFATEMVQCDWQLLIQRNNLPEANQSLVALSLVFA
jgi:hypothetical protein